MKEQWEVGLADKKVEPAEEVEPVEEEEEGESRRRRGKKEEAEEEKGLMKWQELPLGSLKKD